MCTLLDQCPRKASGVGLGQQAGQQFVLTPSPPCRSHQGQLGKELLITLMYQAK